MMFVIGVLLIVIGLVCLIFPKSSTTLKPLQDRTKEDYMEIMYGENTFRHRWRLRKMVSGRMLNTEGLKAMTGQVIAAQEFCSAQHTFRTTVETVLPTARKVAEMQSNHAIADVDLRHDLSRQQIKAAISQFSHAEAQAQCLVAGFNERAKQLNGHPNSPKQV